MEELIGKILDSEGEARANLLANCSFLEFDKEEQKIIDTMQGLKIDFNFADLYLGLDVENKREIISKCMKCYREYVLKQQIKEANYSKDDVEGVISHKAYADILKRMLNDTQTPQGLTETPQECDNVSVL